MTGALRSGKVQSQQRGCVAAALAFSRLGVQSLWRQADVDSRRLRVSRESGITTIMNVRIMHVYNV